MAKMESARWTLREMAWPEFGMASTAPVSTLDEYRQRLARTRERMATRGLTHLVVYGDREHFANLAWLTRFDPRFEEALLIVGVEGKPLLLTGNECQGYLPISPLWKAGDLRTERYQPFSLLDQPRDASRTLEAILPGEGIADGARVGCAGWKYYGDRRRMDTPAYIVDALRELASEVEDATDLFVHAGYGLRARCSASEIAFFEYSNGKASEAMKRIHFAARCGMTDHELLEHARYDGLPLACAMTLKTGPNRISLASPSGNRLERSHFWSANIAYWGSNICRAAWVAESEEDLPAAARDYVEAFAGPYFAAMCEWLGTLRIGSRGGDLYRLIQERLPFKRFRIYLNPGHLIHLDEWVSSPFFEGSEIAVASGMVIQTDVIPSSPAYSSTRMEDGVAIADAALREELRRDFPECAARCHARREFLAESLGIELPEEVLPLSNTACLVAPYLLRPELVFAIPSRL
jgi:hypothetical protein